jgi:ubiquinone/menaquinone biosynthesis C-methylase UbiE
MRQNTIWDNEYSRLEWRKETRTLPSRVLAGKKVLELGVGNGKTLISIMRQHPKEVHAIDFSEKAIEICRDKFHLDDIKFLKADVLNLPFEDNSFDAVVCYYVLNNLNENERNLAVREMFRVLKNEGIVLFEDFSVGDFRFKKGSNTIADNTIMKVNGISCHFFTDKEIKELFNDFSKVKLEVRETKPLRGKDYTRKLINAVIRK